MLQAYVNDLSEQNEVLVQTVEELEKEANDRVEILESKLQKTAGTHKVTQNPVYHIVQCTIRSFHCMHSPKFWKGFSKKQSVLKIDDVRVGRRLSIVGRLHRFTFWLNCSIFFISQWITSIFRQLLKWMNFFNICH